MSKQFIYELVVKDKLTGKLVQVSNVGQQTYNKLIGQQQRYNQEVETGSTLIGKLGGLFSLYMAGQTITNIVKMGAAMEQTRVAFGTFLGSAEKANQVLAGLNEFANVTPFNNEEVIKGGRSLLAANIPAEKLQDVLRNIGDVASGANQPLTEMALIYAKAMNKGKVQAEELNQLAERGVPILNTLAEMYGVTTAEVMKMGEKGQLTSSVMQKAFEVMTGKGGMFFNMMEKQSQTLGGKWSTLVGTMQKYAITLGEAVAPALKSVIDAISSAIGWIERNTEVVMLMISSLTGAAIAYGIYYLWVNKITIITKVWTAMQWLLNAAMAANPIMLIVVAIGALIAAIVYAWYKFDGFRGAVFGLWEAFKQVFVGIKDLVKGTMGGVAELILGALTFDISMIQSGLKQLGASFSAYGSGIAAAYKVGSDAGKAFKPKVPDWLTQITGGGAGSETAAAGDPTGQLGSDLAVQQGIGGITGGGSKATNITINLGKFQDQLIIQTQTMQDGLEQLEDKVMEIFLRVVNSANKVATQ